MASQMREINLWTHNWLESSLDLENRLKIEKQARSQSANRGCRRVVMGARISRQKSSEQGEAQP